MDGDNTELKGLLCIFGGASLLLGLLGLVIRSAVGGAKSDPPIVVRRIPPYQPPPRAFDVIRENDEPVSVIVPTDDEDAEGRFQVDGVDRETKMDTRWHCYAASAENAKAKGELEGIVVTRVTRIG